MTKIKFSLLFLFLFFGISFIAEKRQNAQNKVIRADEKFKNLTVLNAMPAEEMGKVMNIMSQSLGVDCNFCHIGFDFEKDGKKEKEISRKMLKMTFEINERYFKDRSQISCNTCHQGQIEPISAPNLNFVKSHETPEFTGEKPTVEQILDKYEKAIGGAKNLEKIRSRFIKAIRIEPDGTEENEEIRQQNGKLSVKTEYPDYLVTEGFDGENAWKRGNSDEIILKDDEKAQIKREAQLFANPKLNAVYSKMSVFYTERINGEKVYLINAKTPENLTEKLYFEEKTGFLVRRTASTPTVLGDFVYQVDYKDYKNFGGVKLPTTVRFAVPNISWTRKILEVKNNFPFDAKIFESK